MEEIKAKLADKRWRLENLYYVTDKFGQKVLFKLNDAQRHMLDNLWYLNLVLKARQRGITTFIAIFFLDAVLFEKNQKALVIAHTKQDAQKIFDSKIKFAFDNLPEWLKMQYVVDTDNVNTIKFKNNGSEISVATSGRSGTYQYLHVSEFGIICSLFPEKAKEIVTGSLNTVQTGNIVFIESTAAGRSGYFYDYCMKAMKDLKGGAQLTAMDWKFFFFPWYQDKGYALEGDVLVTTEMQEYFTDLEIKHGVKLTKEQKNWYIKKAENQKEEMLAEYPSTPEDAFKASIQGSYYGKDMLKMITEKRITTVNYDKMLPVHTVWDLGVGDSTAIIFFQHYRNEYRIIDCLESSGEGLDFYVKALKDRPYVYGNHYAPHDIQVKELGTGTTRLETAERLGIRFEVVPKIGIDDGINAVRMKLNQVWIDQTRCQKLIKALSEYRKEWDDVRGEFKNKPLHDENSHFADATRYLFTAGEIIDYSKVKVYEDPVDEPLYKEIGI